MNKFIFKKNIKIIRTADSKSDDIIRNPMEWANEQKRLDAQRKRQKVQIRTKSREEYNDAPFVLVTYNPSFHHFVHHPLLDIDDYDEHEKCKECGLPAGHESHIPVSYELIDQESTPHSSGENRFGGNYARQLKQLLRNSDKWERIEIKRPQYAANKKITDIAPVSIEGYRRRDPDAVVSTSAAKLINTNNNASRLLGQASNLLNNFRSLEDDSLEPNTLSSIINVHGKNSIPHLMRAAIDNAPFRIGGDLCAACGEEANHPNHDVHEFLPQTIDGKPGYSIRIKQNPLLYTQKRVDRGALPPTIQVGTAFDPGQGPKGDYIPMVHITSTGDTITRYTTEESMKEGQRQLQNYAFDIHSSTKPCTCGDGKANSKQRDNRCNCRDCEKGKITEIESTDSSGNPILVPHTEGMGNGSVKYINPETAPDCRTCSGNGTVFDGTKDVRCPNRDCNGGKDMKTESCSNCGSKNSSISLTDDNVCRACNGSMVVENKFVESPRPRAKTAGQQFQGMATMAMPVDQDYSTNTGVDAYTHIPNPNCKDHAHRDPNSPIPCHCQARSAADLDCLPPGTRLFHADRYGKNAGFWLPKRDLQEAFETVYGKDQASNPHDFLEMPNLVDPETNKTALEQYQGKHGVRVEGKLDGKPIDQRLFTGMVVNGFRLPQDALDEAYRQSQEHWKAADAHYTAPSRDLALARKLIEKHISTAPDIVPSSFTLGGEYYPFEQDSYEPEGRSRIVESFPEHMQDAVKGTEDAIKALPDESRYKPIKENIYDTIMHGDHEKASRDINNMLEIVEKFHGRQKAKEVASSFSKFPVTTDIKWSTPYAPQEAPNA